MAAAKISPAQMKDLMRHSDIETTMNVYGNALMDSKRDANSKVAKLALGQGLSPQNTQPKATVN